MQRRKASVQQGTGREMRKALKSEIGKAAAMNKPEDLGNQDLGNGAAACAPSGEMAGLIVNQLRRAYDELLNEPVPDHLRQLLVTLSEAEDKP